MSNKPYTYLIGWSKFNKFYYGVRYAKNCDPSDLWVKYFTSSNIVKEFRKTNGEPDIIEVRKLFSTKQEAIVWENKVLKRIYAVKREDFLNGHDRLAPPLMTKEILSKSLVVLKGDARTEKQKQAAIAHAERMRNKTSKKAKEVCLFGVVYKTWVSALRSLHLSGDNLKLLIETSYKYSNIEQFKKFLKDRQYSEASRRISEMNKRNRFRAGA